MRRTVDELLRDARARLPGRLSPRELESAFAAGALVVDIRPADLRARDGLLPGAVVIERNVLEWRLDPASADGMPGVSYDRQIVLFCDEGYASSLAAAGLHDLGLRHATDLDGGIQAWIASGRRVSEAM